MLYEFRQGNNATMATKKICSVCPNALDISKCQCWFTKFWSDNFNLSDAHCSGRQVKLDSNLLCSAVEAENCQMIKELSENLIYHGLLYKSIFNRLGRSTDKEFGSHIDLQLKTELNIQQSATFCWASRKMNNSSSNYYWRWEMGAVCWHKA